MICQMLFSAEDDETPRKAFQRVESVEKSEASLQQEVATDSKRMSQLEEALHKAETKEAEVEKENSELKHELEEQVASSKKAAARLDALEAPLRLRRTVDSILSP
ncbi:unnamed protein product [Symbiodinium natans]|uniref:Uncharacterized protein n=1 Tax=Symbiodinium natans TaxID=878477 RepID=A0A812ILA0_9DINO|nr:unnamed protein product [Symbiodinium natans]